MEQSPNESTRGTAGETPAQEGTLHNLEDISYSQSSETAHIKNEIIETDVEEHHGNLITELLTPSELKNLETQPRFVSAESAVGNIQTVKKSRPQLEQPRAETRCTTCGGQINFSTFVRNGVQAVGNEGSKKSNTRKTRKPPFIASVSKKQKAISGLEPSVSVAKSAFAVERNNTVSALANMAVVQRAVNKSVSSGAGNHRPPEIYTFYASTSVANPPETVRTEEFVVRSDMYVTPGAYASPQSVDLNVQEHTPPSQLEDTETESSNTLKIVDVFSAHEILNTSTPEYGTNTLQSSSKQNWHFPSPTEDQSNSLPSSTCRLQSSSKNPTIRNWHTPVPANYPQKTSKEDEVLHSGSTSNSVSLQEEEGEVLVEIANKDLIAQHLERCPSGFMCKFCSKQYKIQTKCENHIQIHLGVKPYECQICKRRYMKRRILNEHYSFHMGEKLYQCKLCDSSYRHRKNFKKHAESHEEFNSSYLCEICNKHFQLQFDYWSHITSTHVIVESDSTFFTSC